MRRIRLSFSVLSFLLAFIFLAASPSVTGAVVGVSAVSSFFGVLLALLSGALFISGFEDEETNYARPKPHSLEKRIHLVDKTKTNPTLRKMTNKIKTKPGITRELEEITKELSSGDLSDLKPIKGTPVEYVEGKRGAIFVEREEGSYNVLARTSSADVSNARRVIENKYSGSLSSNPAGLALRNNTIYTSPKDLFKLARECDYLVLDEGRKEGVSIYSGETIITVVPRHKSINTGTAKGIMKVLASGESSFRKQDKKN